MQRGKADFGLLLVGILWGLGFVFVKIGLNEGITPFYLLTIRFLVAFIILFIIKRLPLRFTFDNNYFNDKYQGIPIGGYTAIIEKMLDGIPVELEKDFLKNRSEYQSKAKKMIYTGAIDAFYDYKLGALDYRSLNFQSESLAIDNYQGNAVVNHIDKEIPYTRIIEHKHFEFGTQPRTIITKEFPKEWKLGDEPYYPINDKKNDDLSEAYKTLSKEEKNVYFGGRLAEYRYYDMHQVIASALNLIKKIKSS